MAGTIRRNEKALAGYAEAMTCHLATSRPTRPSATRSATWRRRRQAARRPAARRGRGEPGEAAPRATSSGSPPGAAPGYAVVVQAQPGGKGEGAAPTVLTADRQLRRLTLVDVPTPVDPMTTCSIPKEFNATNPKSRRDLAADPAGQGAPRAAAQPGARRATEPARTSGSPSCAARCGPTPATSAPTARTTPGGPSGGGGCARETDGIAAQGRRSDQLGGPHVRPDLRPAGRAGLPVRRRHPGHPGGGALRRLYTEKDLLAAECLRHGVWRRLDPAGLAAAVSMLVHEPRRTRARSPADAGR